MIDAHELTEYIWARYNSTYNNSVLHSEDETNMAKMVLKDVQSAIDFFDKQEEIVRCKTMVKEDFDT